MSRKRPGRSAFRISTRTEVNISPLSSPAQRLTLSSTQWTPVTRFLRLKRPWLEVKPLPFSFAETKSDYSYSHCCYCLHAVHKDSFRFGFLLRLS